MSHASCPARAEPTLNAWSRTARPVRPLRLVATRRARVAGPARDDDRRLDDVLFGCGAAALLALPLVLAVVAFAR